jgi:hypothetical protein
LPANDCTSAPTFAASAFAPSFIFTKNGLVSVLVISPILTFSPPPLVLLPPLSSSPLPQAARPPMAMAPTAANAVSRKPRRADPSCMISSPPVNPLWRLTRPDNVFTT